MITDKHFLMEKPGSTGGVQRIYRFSDGHGLSLVNSSMLHSYGFAWEAAVLSGVDDKGKYDNIIYDTELTNDVEVFQSNAEANAFIERAAKLFGEAV